MNETSTITHPHTSRKRGAIRGNWPRWIPYAAAVWSLGYGIVALVWTLTGEGYPLGENDAQSMGLVGRIPADVGAPIFAAVALAASAIAAGMARPRTPATAVPLWWRRSALWAGSTLAVVLLAIVPDTRILAIVGYLPMIVFVAPFDADIRDKLDGVITAAHVNHVVVIVGGFLWALATLVFARRTAGACAWCGRGGGRVGPRTTAGARTTGAWTTPAAVARWGRPVTYLAAAIPAFYSLTRWLWAFGVPFGISEEFHAQGEAEGAWFGGAWLGSFALVGAVLTIGLVQRWGEVFPRWFPVIGGRAVPIGLATVPASIVAALATSGGIGMYSQATADGALELTADSWGAIGPTLLWPLWGVALAAATLAYYLRRRGTCAECGLGARPTV